MFDNMTIVKGFKLTDNITGNDVEIATYNAVLNKDSNINVYMNINYPVLYNRHKTQILEEYRDFCAEITTLACTMGLAEEATGAQLYNLETVSQEFKEMASEVFAQVIESLGDIRVNPVPSI
jgi:hypothetical protein